MFHKYIYLIIFCLLSSFAAKSQNVPGYLGKKAFIDYNFNMPYPIYLGPKKTNFIHNFNFNYVIRRRAQLGLTADFFKLHALPGDRFSTTTGEKFYSSVSGGAVGINFDWYNKRSIAPVGNYFRLTAKKMFGKYQDYDAISGVLLTLEGDYDGFAFAFGYGIRRIFFDQMVFNVGGSFEYVTGGFTADERGYNFAVGSSYYWKFHVGIGILLF